MKKISRISVASLLVLGILAITAGSVFASSSALAAVDEWLDPTASANGGSSFSSEVVAPSSLPGTVNEDAGMIMPVGFTFDTGQFGGNGIKISGLATSADTANLTFSFPTYRYGWAGSIYKWDGSSWVAVPTTIVAPTGENSMYYATASKVGNGTYALIVGYEGLDE